MKRRTVIPMSSSSAPIASPPAGRPSIDGSPGTGSNAVEVGFGVAVFARVGVGAMVAVGGGMGVGVGGIEVKVRSSVSCCG